jgi:hypothetical protein
MKRIKIREIKKVFQIFLVKCERRKQRSLSILFIIHLSIIAMVCGPMTMYYLYLYGALFCCDCLGVSLTSVTQTVATVLLTIVFTINISKRTDHSALPTLSCLSYMIQLVSFGIVTQV